MDSHFEPPSPPDPANEPAALPRVARGHPFATFAAMLLVSVGPGAVAQVTARAPGLAWTQIFAFLLPAAAFAAASNLDPLRALRLDARPPRHTVALGLAIGGAGFVAAGAVMALVSAALPRSWVENFDVRQIFEVPRREQVALALVAALLAPLCEEIAFRGHFLSVLGARLRPRGAIALTALLFALMHLDPVRFVAVLALGGLFGWLAWRAGSVWPAVAAHLANNAVGTLLTLAASARDLRAAAEAEKVAPVAALGLLGLGILLVAPLAGLYAKLTPAPPPLESALAPLDPDDDDPRLRLRRVPGWMLVFAVVGILFVVAMLALKRLR